MREKERIIQSVLIVVFTLTVLFFLNNINAASDPTGPDDINIITNETKNTTSGQIVNISGGYIADMNITATVQNKHWKAFVGHVIGEFTLQDASGNTIYDWTMATTTGRLYATRNDTTILWSSINCSNTTHLESENSAFGLTSADDNITKTFNATFNVSGSNKTDSGSHNAFYVGNVYIPATTCPTLNTYVDNNTQDAEFEEMALYDTVSHVYATILENDEKGYDSLNYDFQMIVPENGTGGFGGATPYYIYVELGN